MHKHIRLYPGTIVLTSLMLSVVSPITADSSCVQKEQEVLVTAYYSPLPNQNRYYLGSYEEDVRFNGRGIAGADGTEVYPGMMAAPAEFDFGTRVEIPELGVVGTVHDRGGRIVTGSDGIPRIDIWMGEGEEGLARALQWGARRVTANIYHTKPKSVPAERFDLAQFPAPESALDRMPSNPIVLVDIDDLRYGDTSSEVAAIQHALKVLGYFDHDITSYFGDVTKNALDAFQRDANVGSSAEVADERTRSTLVAHRQLADELLEPLPGEEILLTGQDGRAVRIVQRVLKLLSKYEGEIDGEYDSNLMSVVYNFQYDRGIVSSLSDTGAGMIGPQTRRALLTAWRNHRMNKRGGLETLVAGL